MTATQPNQNKPNYFRLRTFIAAGALAAAALSMASGLAQAKDSETTIKNDCTSQVGGTYTTTVDSNGHRTSKCCYEGLFGVTHCDVFVDGEYDDGQSFLEQPPVKPPVVGPRPVPPGVLSPQIVEVAPSKDPVKPSTPKPVLAQEPVLSKG
ncbi:hypothetical protein [Mycobacterium sp. URHB0044]|jgi:hypothetical protein|uniref:hypothetical protein n=1 Tax=Mycobacterium sp. URHB0044 TaxID=1380386 RepID=UPI000B142A6C|nr:hypothetical protein [Mycobacterium sp. URHB0044]